MFPKSKIFYNSKRGEEFNCCNCGEAVSFSEFIGTEHRNHCPLCLWSKHLDLRKPGDRKSKCESKMKPIGLTFKREGVDKYGMLRQGEIMLIHKCVSCKNISINRIAADDDSETILKVFEESQKLSLEEKKELEDSNIEILLEKRREEILTQLFGKDSRKT